MKPIPSNARNKRVSNPRQRKQQHLLDVKIRESKERSRRYSAITSFVCKVVLFGGLIGGLWFGGKEALRKFVWENPDYFLREINVSTDGALTREQVLNAAGLSEGRNIFTVDLAATRSAIEKLPQVDSAVVQRLLPNRMAVTVTERRPIAWVAAKGDEDPSSSDRSFLIDARGIVLRSRVLLPEYFHLPIISGFETENLVLGRRVPAWEMQAALELVRLNADNTRFQVRNIDLSKGYKLVVTDQRRATITFRPDDIEEQLLRLNLYHDHAAREGREIRTINVAVQRNVPVTYVEPEPEAELAAQTDGTPPAKTAASVEPAPRRPEPPAETAKKEIPVAKAAAAPTPKSRTSGKSQFVKKPFRQTR